MAVWNGFGAALLPALAAGAPNGDGVGPPPPPKGLLGALLGAPKGALCDGWAKAFEVCGWPKGVAVGAALFAGWPKGLAFWVVGAMVLLGWPKGLAF